MPARNTRGSRPVTNGCGSNRSTATPESRAMTSVRGHREDQQRSEAEGDAANRRARQQGPECPSNRSSPRGTSARGRPPALRKAPLRAPRTGAPPARESSRTATVHFSSQRRARLTGWLRSIPSVRCWNSAPNGSAPSSSQPQIEGDDGEAGRAAGTTDDTTLSGSQVSDSAVAARISAAGRARRRASLRARVSMGVIASAQRSHEDFLERQRFGRAPLRRQPPDLRREPVPVAAGHHLKLAVVAADLQCPGELDQRGRVREPCADALIPRTRQHPPRASAPPGRRPRS